MAKTDKPSTKRTTNRAPARAEAMVPHAPQPTTEAIARRAFELFLARGAEHGRAIEDWVRAERELRAAT